MIKATYIYDISGVKAAEVELIWTESANYGGLQFFRELRKNAKARLIQFTKHEGGDFKMKLERA